MKKHSLFFAVAFAALTVFVGCSDDDVPAIEYTEQGFIKGTVKGNLREDSTTIDESFSFSRSTPPLFEGSSSYYEVNDDNSIQIYASRQDLKGGGASVQLYLETAADTSPDYNVYVTYLKEESTKIIYFNMSTNGSNEATLTNFSFDQASGRLKGDFTITGENNSTDNAATIAGSFDLVVKESIE